MRIGSLFSGAGGLDMAVEEVFGGTVVWQCEFNEAASKVLAHRYPGVPNFGDVTSIDWDTVEPVDVMCGGYPCQPFSAAGQRKGTDDERHLWPHFAEAIRRVRPRYVVLENVAGHRSMGFDSVLGDLAAIGYVGSWCSVRASDVGAPHRRERVFILAVDANTAGDGRHEGWPESAGLVGGSDVAERSDGSAADTASQRGADITRRGDTAGQHVLAVAGAGDRDCERATAAGVSELGGTIPELATLTIGCVCWEHLTTHSGHCCWRDEPSDGWPDDEPPCGHRHLGDGGPRRDGLCPTCTEAQRLGLSSWSCPDPNMCGGGHVDLLPTPSAADGGGGHLTRSGARSAELLLPGVARAYGNGDLLPTPTTRDFKGANKTVRDGSGGRRPLTAEDTTRARGDGGASSLPDVVSLLPTPNASDGSGGGQHPDQRDGHPRQLIDYALLHGTSRWGKYEAAIRRWESITRPAPSPTEPNTRGNPRLAAAFPEWMQGWPAGWVTALVALGIISRNDALRIIGNGVCPQQAVAALRWLLQIAPIGVAA